MQREDEPAEPNRDPFQFNTTRWSLVVAAGDSQSAAGTTALNELCRSYWQPVFAFVRKSVANAEDARDLTQSFFADLLSDRSWARADAEVGRFRCFLLGALKHFLADAHDWRNAKKRGGGVDFIPLDLALAETRYGMERSAAGPPESQFDQAWALAVLDRTLARLRHEFELSGRLVLFDALKGFLTGDKPSLSYAQAAAALGLSEGAAKMTVTRMRQRFRAILRQEIAQTVTTPEQLEAELRAFVAALVG